MYNSVNKTPKDDLFQLLSEVNNTEQQQELLEKNGFESIRKGKYSNGIYHDGQYLIKFFNMNNYGKNPATKDYIDYHLYTKIENDNLNIFPNFYGYCEEKFIVVEYIGEHCLWKTINYNFSLEDIHNLINDFFYSFKSLYQKTGILIDDIAGKNIIYRPKENKFYFVDFSCISIFSSGYFAQEYLIMRLEKLMDTFYKRGWITKKTLVYANKILLEKSEEGYFWT